MEDLAHQTFTQLHRSKRHRGDARKSVPDSWADIRLPAMTRLQLHVSGESPYTGGAAFLIVHTALLELDITTLLVSVGELTAVFQSAALPQLTRLALSENMDDRSRRDRPANNLAPLVAALATTVVGASGRLRPIETLSFQLPATNEFLAVAAVITGLTSLEINPMMSAGWLEEWTRSPEMLAAFPLLQRLSIRTDPQKRAEAGTITSMLPFLEQMAGRSLRQLSVHTDGPVIFDAAAMGQLAGWCQLRELDITSAVLEESEYVHWTKASLSSPCSAKFFPFLRSLTLRKLRLSAESVTDIAAAAPLLERLELSFCMPSCHPAVICAIFAGFCEHIEDVKVGEGHEHLWTRSCAADVTAAYQSAVAAAGRGEGYRPFTRLRNIWLDMCWCTPPSVWHALLSLLRWATSLCAVKMLTTIDPLVVSALCYLSSVTVLESTCLWPASFAALMQQRDERTGRYRYHTSHGVTCPPSHIRGVQTPTFLAVWYKDEGEDIQLRLHSNAMDAFRRSLSDEHQAVLARWARGDFRAGDEQLTAVESAWGADEDDEADAGGRHLCPHTQLVYYCHSWQEDTFT